MPQEVHDEPTFILAERIEDVLPAAFNPDLRDAGAGIGVEPVETSSTSSDA